MIKFRLSGLPHFALFALTALLLAACQTTTSVIKPDMTVQATVEAKIIGANYEQQRQWAEAASMFRQLSEQTTQPERSLYLQKTALMMYRLQQNAEIIAFYDGLAENDLLEQDAINKNVLLAGIYFEQGKTYQSLGNLPELDSISNPIYKAIALNIRSRGVLAIGKPLESAKLRIEIGQHLESDVEKQENYDFIWDALNRITEPNILNALAQQQTMPLRGWLELNLIARRSDMLPSKIEPWIKKWHEIYLGHEASISFADRLVEESKLIYIDPLRIALLLPLTDNLKNVSEAIQNGFLYAYYNDPESKPVLEIINVSSEAPQFFQQYRAAIQNGADFIVGPLDKQLVNELQQNHKLEVPTLTLNYADDELKAVKNLYQFGLRPEDEAEQIADYALTNGHYHAVTLTPDSALGQRLQQAFSSRFEKLGGQVVERASYPSSKNDYSPTIKQMLNLNSSERRHSILDQITGQTSEFIPRRRQDVDMIFIAGNPRQARLIKPQLKFHHAKDLPVYTTSSISSGVNDQDADRDLNETLFVDMPWSLKQQENSDYIAVKKLWPEQSEQYSRFFALGIDAYKLIPSLRRLLINPEEKINLNTGTITVDSSGRVHRELLLATFNNGQAELLKKSVESVK
ncbi:MAG: penicillin-binding protein activator [Gammaproteobacteria bacterium]|nr:penicillin-binding protein activator [Gammaproteobacteria bacterium]MBL6999991.1 penicillin-binding protein activator [Gammaproteobacteria bacterium]